MNGQDWAPVILRGSKSVGQGQKATLKNVTPEAAAARRLEQQDVPQKPKELSTGARTEIMQRRAAMKKTQGGCEINRGVK
jgi:hypothetical protein